MDSTLRTSQLTTFSFYLQVFGYPTTILSDSATAITATTCSTASLRQYGRFPMNSLEIQQDVELIRPVSYDPIGGRYEGESVWVLIVCCVLAADCVSWKRKSAVVDIDVVCLQLQFNSCAVYESCISRFSLQVTLRPLFLFQSDHWLFYLSTFHFVFLLSLAVTNSDALAMAIEFLLGPEGTTGIPRQTDTDTKSFIVSAWRCH